MEVFGIIGGHLGITAELIISSEIEKDNDLMMFNSRRSTQEFLDKYILIEE